MGHDLYQEYDFVRDIFDMVDDITKISISRLCFKGPMEELTHTVNLQPAVTAVNLSCFLAMARQGVEPDVTAGHSLGEYSALCASGVLTPEETLRLVFKRGRLMHREAERHKGVMHAVMGLDMESVREVVRQAQREGVVSVANHNTAEQIVITGSAGAVKKAAELAKEKGARSVALQVSGAWHSELIRGAEAEFNEYLAAFDFRRPGKPVVMNVTGLPCEDPREMKEIMCRQLCSPVCWYDSVLAMHGDGVEVYVEVGPKRVLSGMLKKILPDDPSPQVHNVDGMKGLEAFLRALG